MITPKKRVEYKESEIKIYTQVELDKFEEQFSKTNLLSDYKIGRDLGVRCGECFGLLWSDINWDKHTIKINKQLVYEDKMWTLRNTRTMPSIRQIELQDSNYKYLKEFKAIQEQQKAELGATYRETKVAVFKDYPKGNEIMHNLDFINLKPTGEFLTPDSVKVLSRIVRDELGLKFKFHNLRHSHASWLAEHNVPIVVTKTRLGHSKEETTNRYYIHLTQGMRENLLNTLNSI